MCLYAAYKTSRLLSVDEYFLYVSSIESIFKTLNADCLWFLCVVVVIRYFSDEIKYAIVFVFFNSISIKFLFPKAHGVWAYRQLFLAGDVVILNTNQHLLKRLTE